MSRDTVIKLRECALAAHEELSSVIRWRGYPIQPDERKALEHVALLLEAIAWRATEQAEFTEEDEDNDPAPSAGR